MTEFENDLYKILLPPVVILGVGNRQRGDDAAGAIFAERVSSFKLIPAIDTGEMPENFTFDVKAHSPKTILFVDVVDAALDVGEVVLLEHHEIKSKRFSSHRPSLRLVMDYLAKETDAKVWLLGIQPENTELGEPISEKVLETVKQLVTIFEKVLNLKKGVHT